MKKQICCKKCGKELPKGYKHKYCEFCKNKHADKVRTGLKTAGGIALSALVIVGSIISGGKIKSGK